MSFAALAWAATQRPGNLAAKMVLLGLANFADEQGCAYPSTAALAEFGDMNHKTATAAMDRLVELGLIADTGRRTGQTKQIKVYRLNLESTPKTEASQKRKPPVSSVKAPQKRGTDTIREPIPSEAKASSVPRKASDAASDLRERVKRGTPLPSSFDPILTDEARRLVDGWPPGFFDNELAQWRDHHIAKGTIAKDWQASLRTWLRNAEKFRNQRNGRQLQPTNSLRGSRPDPSLDMLRQAQAEIRATENQGGDCDAWPSLPSYRAN